MNQGAGRDLSRRFDPLAGLRAAEGDAGPTFDLLLSGWVFTDIIFTGLGGAPADGTEVWADGMGTSPGGVANQAIAASRLGLHTSLAAAFGDDGYGEFTWGILADQEHVDLSRSRRFPHWHSPVTVSLSINRDRSMISHGHPGPVTDSALMGDPPAARAAMAPVREVVEPWAVAAANAGTPLFGHVGWDPTGDWSPDVLESLRHFHAFLPNAAEAMALTRTEDPWAALYALADRVPIAVVTHGSQGALAIDAITGEEEWAPALPVTAWDPTGAGDSFSAAFLVGTLAGWPLADRLGFANLCASLSVQQVGGSLAAPGWGDIADWWHAVAEERPGVSRHWLRRYRFLADLIADVPPGAVRRATATIGRLSDA